MAERLKCLKTLGLQTGATEDEIKKAYKRLALQYHPDKNTSADAHGKFQEIGYAYKYLTEGPTDFQMGSQESRDELFRRMFAEMFMSRFSMYSPFSFFFHGDDDSEDDIYFSDDSEEENWHRYGSCHTGRPGSAYKPRHNKSRSHSGPFEPPPPTYHAPSKKALRKQEKRKRQRDRAKERAGERRAEEKAQRATNQRGAGHEPRTTSNSTPSETTRSKPANSEHQGMGEKPDSRPDTPAQQATAQKLSKKQRKKLEGEQRKREAEMAEIAEQLLRKQEAEQRKAAERERKAAELRDQQEKENIDFPAMFETGKMSKKARQRERRRQEAETKVEMPTSIPHPDNNQAKPVVRKNSASSTSSSGAPSRPQSAQSHLDKSRNKQSAGHQPYTAMGQNCRKKQNDTSSKKQFEPRVLGKSRAHTSGTFNASNLQNMPNATFMKNTSNSINHNNRFDAFNYSEDIFANISGRSNDMDNIDDFSFDRSDRDFVKDWGTCEVEDDDSNEDSSDDDVDDSVESDDEEPAGQQRTFFHGRRSGPQYGYSSGPPRGGSGYHPHINPPHHQSYPMPHDFPASGPGFRPRHPQFGFHRPPHPYEHGPYGGFGGPPHPMQGPRSRMHGPMHRPPPPEFFHPRHGPPPPGAGFHPRMPPSFHGAHGQKLRPKFRPPHHQHMGPEPRRNQPYNSNFQSYKSDNPNKRGCPRNGRSTSSPGGRNQGKKEGCDREGSSSRSGDRADKSTSPIKNSATTQQTYEDTGSNRENKFGLFDGIDNISNDVKYARGGTLDEIESLLTSPDRQQNQNAKTSENIEPNVINIENLCQAQEVNSLDSLDDFGDYNLSDLASGYAGDGSSASENGNSTSKYGEFLSTDKLDIKADMFTDRIKNYYS